MTLNFETKHRHFEHDFDAVKKDAFETLISKQIKKEFYFRSSVTDLAQDMINVIIHEIRHSQNVFDQSEQKEFLCFKAIKEIFNAIKHRNFQEFNKSFEGINTTRCNTMKKKYTLAALSITRKIAREAIYDSTVAKAAGAEKTTITPCETAIIYKMCLKSDPNTTSTLKILELVEKFIHEHDLK